MDDIYETYKHNGLTVVIRYDQNAESPTEWGNFTIINHREIELDDDDNLTTDMLAKLADGRAFWVDKYEHSGVSYTLAGEGMNDRWDTSSKWGIIEFTDEYATNFDDYEGRRKMAAGDLKEYTAWAEGEVYGYQIYKANPTGLDDDEELDACWGFIGDVDYCKTEANAIADSYRQSSLAKKAQTLHN